MKSNEIIKKFQTEIKSLKAKQKLKNQLTLQQEHLLEEKIEEIESIKKELGSVKLEVQTKVSELTVLQQSNQTLEEKVEGNEKCIDDNNHGNVY